MWLLKLSISLVSLLVMANDHQAPPQGRVSDDSSRPQAQARTKQAPHTARFGDVSLASGSRRLFIYSKENLTEVEFLLGKAPEWGPLNEVRLENPIRDGEWKAYGSANYLPTTIGQTFAVRAVRPDGSRFTTELTVEDGKVRVELKKEETKEEVLQSKKSSIAAVPVIARESQGPLAPQGGNLTPALQRALNSVGRTLGNGQCAAVGGGASVGQVGPRGAGWQAIQPGHVLRFGAGTQFFSETAGTFTVGNQGHSAVVESVSADGKVTILHQNWLGGARNGQVIRREVIHIGTLNGRATIQRGD